jgi:hypothetical protein
MTWSSRIVRIAFAVSVLATLALAFGANFVEYSDCWFW